MARFSKRGRNPAAADFWLESLGYYRKNVAYDETCLFRAVSEQLFSTQIKHEEIRRKCISYGLRNSREFADVVPRKRDWFERMKKLSVHMVVCNDVEVQLVCLAYCVNITMFIAATNEIKEFVGHTFPVEKPMLLLCKMGEDHFDAVYQKEHIASAGFCQSVVYNTLYKNVFGIEDAETIAYNMLHDKQTQYVAFSPDTNNKEQSKDSSLDYDDSHSEVHNPQPTATVLAPFPFKIAKALDPNMYRNIEYDTWIEQRREMRLGDWYYGDDKLILGTRCLLHLGDEDLECYIQTMFENDREKCEVYITKLAERLIVNYSDLRREENAKPWPLPYRFSRGQPALVPEPASDNERKSLRRRREKKRLQYQSEQIVKLDTKDASADVNVSNYEGYPLLMQDSSKSIPPGQQLSLITTKDNPENAQEQCDTPLSGTISWPPSPTSQNYQQESYSNTIPVVTQQSDETIHCQESANEMVYTYVEPTSPYPMASLWPPQDQYVLTPDSAICADASLPYRPELTSKYIYYAPDSAYASPTYPSPIPPSTPYAVSPFPLPYNNDSRMMCSTPIAITAPQSDVYPVVYHSISAPGTPVCYPQITIPPPPVSSQRSEFNAIPTPPLPPPPPPPPPAPYAIYTPPAAASTEVPYCNGGGFVYPATPPVTWYNPPYVNSQGFIFPVPATTAPNSAQATNTRYM